MRYANGELCICMKGFRQSLILELVDREAIGSQQQLQKRLRARGVDATQATISRDIKELGLVKRAADGTYRRPGSESSPPAPAHGVERAAAEYLRRVEQVQHLVVLKTMPGQAQPLALSIDAANLPGVVGTVAGDDTVLAIARDSGRARKLARRLEQWARK